jgi:hypothetical protein
MHDERMTLTTVSSQKGVEVLRQSRQRHISLCGIIPIDIHTHFSVSGSMYYRPRPQWRKMTTSERYVSVWNAVYPPCSMPLVAAADDDSKLTVNVQLCNLLTFLFLSPLLFCLHRYLSICCSNLPRVSRHLASFFASPLSSPSAPSVFCVCLCVCVCLSVCVPFASVPISRCHLLANRLYFSTLYSVLYMVMIILNIVIICWVRESQNLIVTITMPW